MTANGSLSVLIPAAGEGVRLGTPKISVAIAGKTLLEWLVPIFQQFSDDIIVAYPPHEAPPAMRHARFIPGGGTRQDTVRMLAAAARGTNVLVHDVARPFLPPAVVRRAVAALAHVDGASAALPMVDSVMLNATYSPVDRTSLLRVQTPQTFRRAVLVHAHEYALAHGITATDDLQLVRHAGGTVTHVAGSPWLRKITTPADLSMAEALVAAGVNLLED